VPDLDKLVEDEPLVSVVGNQVQRLGNTRVVKPDEGDNVLEFNGIAILGVGPSAFV
jgi:hypothetical protein